MSSVLYALAICLIPMIPTFCLGWQIGADRERSRADAERVRLKLEQETR